MLQISRRALVYNDTPEALAGGRTAFERDGAVILSALLDRALLEEVRYAVDAASFEHRVDPGIGAEERMRDNTALALLYLLMNNTAVFDAVRHLTGIGPIRSFIGRVYRLRSGPQHFDSWHSDVQSSDRLLGMSLNLSPRPYAGGRFELRRADSDRVSWSAAHRAPGDAILFRIDSNLAHRVTAVEGDAARIVFAGWFQSRPDFLPLLKMSAPADVTRRITHV